MLRQSLLLASIAAFSAAPTSPASSPDVGAAITQVRSFAASDGDKLWPGYGGAPLGFLLVAGDKEELLCSASVPNGFRPDGTDPASGCARYVRARSGLPDTLLAAMPLFGPPEVIVMGTPQTTGRPVPDWTRTILHEHFHQWQGSLPQFYARVAALDLTGDDKSGMWMLNFPFPYSEPVVVSAFNDASRALGVAVDARGKPGFRTAFANYLVARAKLATSVGEKNWHYAELELWKEGVARWTEIELGKRYPDPSVRASAIQLEQKTRAWLDKPDIAGSRREFVYPYGASEAMLLEACGPGWRSDYPKELALGPMLERASRSCGR